MSLAEDVTYSRLEASAFEGMTIEDRIEDLIRSSRIRFRDLKYWLSGENPQDKFTEATNKRAQRVYGVEKVSEPTLRAMKMVDRRDFVLPSVRIYGREMSALGIGEGQTISSPDTVAVMLDLLEINHDNSILEIGAGSGYSAAVMSKLTNGRIVSLERRKELQALAAINLKRAKVPNVTVSSGDYFDKSQRLPGNMQKLPETYDRIVSCAQMEDYRAAHPLIDRLTEGGIFLSPIKLDDGNVYFCKYVQGQGWEEASMKTQFVPYVTSR